MKDVIKCLSMLETTTTYKDSHTLSGKQESLLKLCASILMKSEHDIQSFVADCIENNVKHWEVNEVFDLCLQMGGISCQPFIQIAKLHWENEYNQYIEAIVEKAAEVGYHDLF